MTNHQLSAPYSNCLFHALCNVVIFKLSPLHLKMEEKYFSYKQGQTYSTTIALIFYNINSLLQHKYLLTTWLSLWSSLEDIHSYVTQPSHMTCTTATPPQTLCNLPLLAQLQCLRSFLSTMRWQDQNTSCLAAVVSAISKNQNTRDADEKEDTLLFLKSSSLKGPGFDLSLWMSAFRTGSL